MMGSFPQHSRPFSWFFLILLITGQIYTIRIWQIDVPEYKVKGEEAKLSCSYDMFREDLYSIKWYKGDKQFYQYIPTHHKQPVLVYDHVSGFQVDEAKSSNSTVVLTNLSLDATGTYKCEIIGEGPLFPTVHADSNLTVIDLPESAPILTGLKKTYQLGEPVNVNCTSTLSKPAATLEWHINRRKVESELELVRYNPIVDSVTQLETAVLGLAFTARRHHFIRGKLNLKCVARIAKVYFQSQESTAIETNYEKMTQAEFSRDKKGFYFFGSGSSCMKMGPMILASGWIVLMVVSI